MNMRLPAGYTWLAHITIEAALQQTTLTVLMSMIFHFGVRDRFAMSVAHLSFIKCQNVCDSH